MERDVSSDWGIVELEPEVRDWILALDDRSWIRVLHHVGLLARLGPNLGEPDTRQLRSKLRELRLYIDRVPVRITYFIATGRRIILLTVFQKDSRSAPREIARAERAMNRCILEGHTAGEDE
jgi:hypothetical protein